MVPLAAALAAAFAAESIAALVAEQIVEERPEASASEQSLVTVGSSFKVW